MKLISTHQKMLVIITTLLFLLPSTSFATNGLFAHGYGAKNKALAGSGIALPQDAMSGATNPAGMVFVGGRMDLGGSYFSPSPRKFTAGPSATGQLDDRGCVQGAGRCAFTFGGQGGNEEITSDNEVFLIPHFAYNWELNSVSTIGFAVYGNGGMNTEYVGGQAQHDDGSDIARTTSGAFGAGAAGINLEQLFITTSYARKYSKKGSWGVSYINAFQTFEAKGLANFSGYSTDPDSLTNNGVDNSFGAGFKVGVQDTFGYLTVAASYQSIIDMKEFSRYSGLFAGDGDMDVPSTWTIGFAVNFGKASFFTYDVQQINYSDVAAISNPISNLVGATNSCASQTNLDRCLGGKDGAGFGWEDMTIHKFGYQVRYSDDWIWRAGFSFANQPIPKSETMFNILAPAVITTHYTFGFTTRTSNTTEFNFSVLYAPTETQSGQNPLDPTQKITLEMSQYEFEASWGWKFF